MNDCSTWQVLRTRRQHDERETGQCEREQHLNGREPQALWRQFAKSLEVFRFTSHPRMRPKGSRGEQGQF